MGMERNSFTQKTSFFVKYCVGAGEWCNLPEEEMVETCGVCLETVDLERRLHLLHSLCPLLPLQLPVFFIPSPMYSLHTPLSSVHTD